MFRGQLQRFVRRPMPGTDLAEARAPAAQLHGDAVPGLRNGRAPGARMNQLMKVKLLN